MDKLDRAVAKLNQAIAEIREITGAAGVRSTFSGWCAVYHVAG